MKCLLLVLLLALTLAQNPPVWPQQFSMEFNETQRIIVAGTTKGKWYYDASNNRQVIERENGRHDRYCESVFQQQDTPCNHIVVANKRFLDFPKKNYCCFCCDSAPGCGIVKPDWMVTAGARYLGEEQLDTQGPYEKWAIKGGLENIYYNKKDSARTPRKLMEVPDDVMDFFNFKEEKVDESHFLIPSYCLTKCALGTFCAGLRGETSQLTREVIQ